MNNDLESFDPLKIQPNQGYEVFFITADGEKHIGYIFQISPKPRKSKWLSYLGKDKDVYDCDEETPDSFRVISWFDWMKMKEYKRNDKFTFKPNGNLGKLKSQFIPLKKIHK